jgi:protein-tyrosine phosphatase
MADQYARHLNFESVTNFRDLGGYKARSGKKVAWRRIYRSGEFSKIIRSDFDRLTGEIGLASVIDLRSAFERERQGLGLLSGAGINYYNISFLADGGDNKANERRYKDFSNMGEFYVYLVGKRRFGQCIVEALEIIAEAKNHPLVFNCAIGKDRTGILAGVLLSALGVADADIIEDYTLSAPYMGELISQKESLPEIDAAVKALPGFFWEAVPESMAMLLAEIKRECGSTAGYLKENGAESSLVARLGKALLV